MRYFSRWGLSIPRGAPDVEVSTNRERQERRQIMAQYAILIYAHDSAHAPDATPDDLETCDRHADELTASGAMLAAYALTPREMATSIRADAITDGPFLDSKEVVAGFYVIEAPDLDAALAIAGRNPVVRDGGGVEVRPLHSGGPIAR
jgi:hypothetical protein